MARKYSALFAIALFSSLSSGQQTSKPEITRIPGCAKAHSDERLIGWGKRGLHFSVPKRGVKVQHVDDIDYRKFTIKTENAVLVVFYGVYPLRQEPDPLTFPNSANASRTELSDRDGTRVGLDSRGRGGNGTEWRSFVLGADKGTYQDASEKAAQVFDKILDSACFLETAH